ncbi:ParA family protein [Halogranum rubrum]|uniref:ATPase involved in chromosome partitioning-like protein n=1 Tax=Halogranum salarium B-1 TaxID=1210908 RepID=J3JI59_9EURY|nr:ParA family protein [Halogranum salarium]EJN61589.1 ATPase involved in chromosome partitioning-like protein [Halogranum salarium B-1]
MKRAVTLWSESGGVGKTTLATNTAAALGRRGADVLVVDLDPQLGSLTDHVGYGELKTGDRDHLGDVLLAEDRDASHLVVDAGAFDLIPSHEGLANIESEMAARGTNLREFRLRSALTPLAGEYDYFLIDPPATLNVLVDNALVAARDVVIPIELTRKGSVSIDGLEDTLDSMQRGFQTFDEDFRLGILAVVPNEVGDSNIYREVREQLETDGKPVTPFGIRKRDVLKQAWQAQMDLFTFADSPETRDLRDYEKDLLDQFEAVARIIEEGSVDAATLSEVEEVAR